MAASQCGKYSFLLIVLNTQSKKQLFSVKTKLVSKEKHSKISDNKINLLTLRTFSIREAKFHFSYDCHKCEGDSKHTGATVTAIRLSATTNQCI